MFQTLCLFILRSFVGTLSCYSHAVFCSLCYDRVIYTSSDYHQLVYRSKNHNGLPSFVIGTNRTFFLWKTDKCLERPVPYEWPIALKNFQLFLVEIDYLLLQAKTRSIRGLCYYVWVCDLKFTTKNELQGLLKKTLPLLIIRTFW